MKLNISLATLALLFSLSASAQVKKWTLEECVTYALEKNISIQQSQLDVQTAEYNKKSAMGNFLPSVNASATHNWNNGLTQDVTDGTLKVQTTQNTSVGLNAGVNLFQGLTNLNTMHRANLQILANQYQIDGMKDDIALMVANSFLQILFNKETLKVRQSQYNLTQQELERTQTLIANGQLPEGEIYELEANSASQEQQIVVAENNVRLSLINLAQLLLINDYENFDISTEDYEIPASVILDTRPSDIYQKALEIRNEVKVSETNVEIAEVNYDLAVGGVSPTLSAFYSYNTRASYQDRAGAPIVNPADPTSDPILGYVSSTQEPVRVPTVTSTTVSPDPVLDQFDRNGGHVFGLQLQIPIFNGFRNHVNMQTSRITLEKARLQLENTKIDLESTVYQSYNDALAASKAYVAAEKTLIARQQAYDYAQERFNVGVINSFEFTQTQQQLEAAQSELVRTKFDYIFKIKVLEFFFGIPITE